MTRISRRTFLQTASTAIVTGTLLGKPASYFSDTSAKFLFSERITAWEYRRGGLGGPWEAWRKANDDANIWTKVEVPHCFNAMDAVDPDGHVRKLRVFVDDQEIGGVDGGSGDVQWTPGIGPQRVRVVAEDDHGR